jgi:hypothetical protein
MELTREEVEFLSAWAREEWEPACYGLPAHRSQLAHGISGAHLTLLIKAWAESEGKKDREILDVFGNADPQWPWKTNELFGQRVAEAVRWRNRPLHAAEASGASGATSPLMKS